MTKKEYQHLYWLTYRRQYRKNKILTPEEKENRLRYDREYHKRYTAAHKEKIREYKKLWQREKRRLDRLQIQKERKLFSEGLMPRESIDDEGNQILIKRRKPTHHQTRLPNTCKTCEILLNSPYAGKSNSEYCEEHIPQETI